MITLNPKEVAERLRDLIKQNNMKLVDVANYLGLKQGSFHAYVDGSRVPPTESLYKLSQLFNVSMEYILTGSEQRNKILSNFSTTVPIKGYDSLTPSEKEKLQIYIEVCISSRALYDSKPQDRLEDDIQFYDFPTVDTLPILGKVAAGTPIEVIQVPLGYLKTSILADYALIASGESMNPIIKNGEYIFVKQISSLNNGEIGIFYINDEATCKLFFRHENKVILKSLNPDFKPFEYSLNTVNAIQILGKVILTKEQKDRYNFFS